MIVRFFTPKTAADVITVECTDTVTTVCASRDVSILAYGGLFGVGVLKFKGDKKSVEDRSAGASKEWSPVSPSSPSSRNPVTGERLDQCIFKKKISGVTAIALTASGDRMYVGTFQKGKGSNNANIEVFHLGAIPNDAPPVEVRGVSRDMPYDAVDYGLQYPADVECVLLSNDDRLLCVGGKAKSVHLFDTASRGLLCEIAYPSAVSSIAFTRPSTVTIALDYHVSDTYSGEISVSDGAIHVFRNTLDAEIIYVNMSSAKVLPGDYPSIVGKELAQDSRAARGSTCKVVFSGRVKRTYSERTGTLLLEDEDEEV